MHDEDTYCLRLGDHHHKVAVIAETDLTWSPPSSSFRIRSKDHLNLCFFIGILLNQDLLQILVHQARGGCTLISRLWCINHLERTDAEIKCMRVICCQETWWRNNKKCRCILYDPQLVPSFRVHPKSARRGAPAAVFLLCTLKSERKGFGSNMLRIDKRRCLSTYKAV